MPPERLIALLTVPLPQSEWGLGTRYTDWDTQQGPEIRDLLRHMLSKGPLSLPLPPRPDGKLPVKAGTLTRTWQRQSGCPQLFARFTAEVQPAEADSFEVPLREFGDLFRPQQMIPVHRHPELLCAVSAILKGLTDALAPGELSPCRFRLTDLVLHPTAFRGDAFYLCARELVARLAKG